MLVVRITDNARNLAVGLGEMSLLAEVRAQSVVRATTQSLETLVKAKASGRPGPNAPHGDYKRSIGHEIHIDPIGGPYGVVGTDAPQGYRLELGFVGFDSLGRFYPGPAQVYPHFGPAVDEIEPVFYAAMLEVVK